MSTQRFLVIGARAGLHLFRLHGLHRRAGVERDFNRGAQYKAHDPNGRIAWKYVSCLVLANEYLDVHGGYFKGAVTQNIPMIAWPCFRVPISRFCYLPKGKTTASPAPAYYKSQELD
jgi:hypothetical protein